MRGVFITFEGTEGSGKSTQIRLLTERLRLGGCVVHPVREPGGTEVGEEIRHTLKRSRPGPPLNSETELLLMNASRAQLVREIIRPALDRGEMVLCDRFYDSTEAYQGYGRGLDLEEVRRMIDFAVGPTRPDLTLIIEVPVSLSEQRRHRRQQRGRSDQLGDRFEQADRAFFERVERGFHEIAARNPDRIRRIDGQGDIGRVATDIWRHVEPLLSAAAV